MQAGPVVLTSGLNVAQAEEIFLLSREVQTLHGKLALDFIQMSHTEATFCMGAQATSHEDTVQEGSSAGRRGVDTQRMGEDTWLHINSLLFHHTIDHQQFMVRLIKRSQGAIQALHDRIWEVVCRVMESSGKSTGDSLGIVLHLVSMLPTIPLQPAFNNMTSELPRYTPRALTHTSQASIDCGAMAVLGEELTRDPTGAHDQVMQASAHVTVPGTISTTFATIEGTGDDRPGVNSSPCSPSHSPNHSPFRFHCSTLTGRQSNSPETSVPDLDSSTPDESASNTQSSLSDSDGQGRSSPDSPDMLFSWGMPGVEILKRMLSLSRCFQNQTL